MRPLYFFDWVGWNTEGGTGGTTDPPTDPPAPPADPPADPEKGKTYDAAYVAELRKEAAGHRKRAQDAEAKLKAKEDAELSETEKRERDLKDATKRAEEAEKRAHLAEVRAEAASAGAVDAADVARLIDPDVEDVRKAIADLKKAKPYLFTRPGAGSADGGAGGKPPAGNSMNDRIRAAAGRR